MLSVDFENLFRSDDESLEELSPPSGFAFSPQGHFLIADDFNHRVQIYNGDKLLKNFGEKGKSDGQFHYPKGITVDKHGNIYVADSWNHRIQKFDSQGNHQQTFGSYGEGKGELNEPYDIMVENCGRILVVERYNHRLQWFSSEGKSLGWIGQRGTVLEEHLAYFYETSANLFSSPAFEFPTSIGKDSQGNYFISDSGNHRIVKFNQNWEQTLTFGQRGEEDGEFQYPLCVSIGDNDLLYVTDLNNNRIQIFSPFGQFLSSIEQADNSSPLKAPCLIAVGPDKKLQVGLTFNPRVFSFSTPSESLESLVEEKVQSDSENSEWLTLQGQIAEQSKEPLRAIESYAEAIQLIQAQKNHPDSAKNFNASSLLNISRIALKRDSPLKDETTLLNGLEIFSRQITHSQKSVLEACEAWEKVAQELSLKGFKKQLEILEDREDPRIFNQELFEMEKQDKVLFRKVRALSYQHCKLSAQLAEYISNIISAQKTSKIIQAGCSDLIKRLKALGDIFSSKLAIKEKNEMALVEAFAELQEDKSKWGVFLTNFHANNRITSLFVPLLFELRSTLIAFKCCAQNSTDSHQMGEALSQIIEVPPNNQVIPKILLGIHETRPTHTIIDTLWRDLIDIWIAHWGKNNAPLITKLNQNYFSPVPFDVEDLNIDEIVNVYNIENTQFKIKSNQLVIGNNAYPTDSLPDAFAEQLFQVLESQTNYDAKNNELEDQLSGLYGQYGSLCQQLKHVNPQDKRSPISINNNISIVNFQISLLRRMILTLEVNEDNNINRLIIGAALLASNKKMTQESSAKSFYESLAAYHSQEEIQVNRIAKEIKNLNFRLPNLKNQESNLNLEQNIEHLDLSIKLENEKEEIKNNLENLKFNFIRRSRICNRLSRLFDFLRQTSACNKKRSVFELVPTLTQSLTPMGPAIGALAQPMGLAFDTRGNLFCVDQENHHVSRISQSGICLARFGGWGNGPGKFQYPVSVQLDRHDNVYVVDMNNQRVQKFSPDGGLILTFGDCEKEGQRLGNVFSASIDNEDNLWVSDTVHHRIQVYDPNGKLISSVTPKDLKHPIGICCLKNEEYLVADQSEDLVKHYDLQGNLLASLKKKDTTFGDLYIMTFSNTHGIFASDHWSSRILHLDSSLNVQGVYGNSGRRVGQFNRIGWMDTYNDLLAVADMCNNRIQFFDAKKTLSS